VLSTLSLVNVERINYSADGTVEPIEVCLFIISFEGLKTPGRKLKLSNLGKPQYNELKRLLLGDERKNCLAYCYL
jgi:hypothetical protein